MSRPVVDAAVSAEPTKSKLGKSGVRAKFVDSKGARLTVQRKRLADGSFQVHVLHLTAVETGELPKVGMVSTHADEAEATAKFDEIVASAGKAGWKMAASSPKALESVFAVLPRAARVAAAGPSPSVLAARTSS